MIRGPDSRHAPRTFLLTGLLVGLLVHGAASARGGVCGESQGSSSTPAEPVRVYERVSVVGDRDEIGKLPGSAHVLDEEVLELFATTDVHRALQRLPGIALQEEDGYGLRPNIGLRGTGVERSSKITLMEDGVLIAPAPYAAPSAYYFPTVARMESIEVRKGSAAVRQGPFSNGGAINLVSSSIPADASGRLRLGLGENGTAQLRANYGQSTEHFGYLVEGLRDETDGFKELDLGGDTGYELVDLLGKLRVNTDPGRPGYHQLELKAGSTDQDGRETYLGLTQADFDRRPNRRYLASSEDNIETDHDQVQLRHYFRTRGGLDVTTTGYRNDYFRDWFKNEKTGGVGNGTILASPALYPLELSYLRGELDSPDDTFNLRHNKRTYRSQGIQTVVARSTSVGGVSHQLELSVRVHEDEEDRLQEEDLYAVRGGRMALTTVGALGSQANRVSSAAAIAGYVEDRISAGRWVLTPGVRYETIDTERLDYSTSDPLRTSPPSRRTNTVEAVVPGLGVSYELGAGWSLVGGVHRGFAPPSPSSREGVDPEESTNFELGARFGGARHSFATMAFFSDYDNLLGTDTASGGGEGTGEQFNGGAATVEGVELSYGTTFDTRGRLLVPLRLSYTHTSSRFDSSFESSFADWAPAVTRGDELPYLARNRLFVETGLSAAKWSLRLAANYADEMRVVAGRGPVPEAESIEDRVVVDFASDLALGRRLRLSLNVRNLLDETYVAARRPYGLRPGLDRTAIVGLRVDL